MTKDIASTSRPIVIAISEDQEAIEVPEAMVIEKKLLGLLSILESHARDATPEGKGNYPDPSLPTPLTQLAHAKDPPPATIDKAPTASVTPIAKEVPPSNKAPTSNKALILVPKPFTREQAYKEAEKGKLLEDQGAK
nr:hypothetical protein CFP56_39394 [Quercus suber]